ncbi:hypothetical protein M409DRAFT_53165 [Zasmidium cellare ATCC 36951]|uniref:Uncharacterized protein n=1 Tax=Zasmidium cellare ATCC 36951 TaxID=1080233 RepID=A0A6A6CRU9_ZASCE|nr:uncharacterized protein M409DRAFT_53165 [Zasmidium cellare ATCC 36951]KAF2168499.1 hypothetical protein M409DRAFT_53165 [Zasmidium cellare ATCC 36951]
MNSPEAIFQREKLDAFRPKNDTENWTERLVLRFNELALRRIHSETKRGFNALLDSCLNVQQKLPSFEEDVEKRALRRDQFPSADGDDVPTKRDSNVVKNPFVAADRLDNALSKIDASLRDMKNDEDKRKFERDIPQDIKDKIEKILAANVENGRVS